jgi:hypothetical protein
MIGAVTYGHEWLERYFGALAVLTGLTIGAITSAWGDGLQQDGGSIDSALKLSSAVNQCTPIECAPGAGLPAGFTLVGKPEVDASSGFGAAAYRQTKTGRIFIAFANSKSVQDFVAAESWATLLPTEQLWDQIDSAAQYATGVISAERHSSKSTDAEIILTGHSLGGALAQYVGTVTGWTTYTFSAPPLRPEISSPLQGKSTGQVTNFVFNNDLVVKGAGILGGPYLGKVIECPGGTGGGHGIESFKTFASQNAGLSSCYVPNEQSISVWGRYNLAQNKAWSDYNSASWAVWQDYSRADAATKDPGSRTRLIGDRDRRLNMLVKHRDRALAEFILQRDRELKALVSERDIALRAAVVQREGLLELAAQEHDRNLKGADKDTEVNQIWKDYNSARNEIWRRYNLLDRAIWATYNLRNG